MVSLCDRTKWVKVPEYMDQPCSDVSKLRRALQELAFVHRWLGGRRAAEKGMKGIGHELPANFSFLDVGCGGGEPSAYMKLWSAQNQRVCRTLSVDFDRSCCLRAREQPPGGHAVLQADGASLPFQADSVDVVHGGLFLHHFSGEAGAAMLRGMLAVTRRVLIIDDLHRHRVPYVATKWGSKLLSRSHMVRHDAPLSVARGFRRQELMELAEAAGFQWTKLIWVWPFRWLAVKIIDTEAE